jgi:hypothetical protein
MTGKANLSVPSAHPFETSPLLGTRQQTKSWGQLVRDLEQEDNVDLDSQVTAGSSLEDVRNLPEGPVQSAVQRESLNCLSVSCL